MNRQKQNEIIKALGDMVACFSVPVNPADLSNLNARTDTVEALYWALQDAKRGESEAWRDAFSKLQGVLFHTLKSNELDIERLDLDFYLEVPYSIIGEGNSKLGFLTFSVCPFVTCPGAGDCLKYCYSPKAWRYPAAFARQVQNTILLLSTLGRQLITLALDEQLARPKYAKRDRIDFRLYVDGDFDSVQSLHYWMETIRARPQLAAYGYSKSFHEFLGYDAALELHGQKWPSNYVLNLSGGHNHSAPVVAAMRALSITRGAFVAVELPKGSPKQNTREQRAVLRDTYGKKAFTCPGKCGDCTPAGHACGSRRFQGRDIIIAAH